MDAAKRAYRRLVVMHRTSLEDYEKYGHCVLEKGFLTAIVKSYTDWSEPKWKIGDGKTQLKDLPYCAGPSSVITEAPTTVPQCMLTAPTSEVLA